MGDWKIIPDDDCVDINDNGIVTFNKECINLKDKYTVIYNNGMCESKTYIIVKKEDVCNKFIVDGGEWDNVPSTGAATCDSAFLWVDGTPQFTPESASTWITINKYYWDTDDPSTMCTNYGNYPCVANNLMYQAGLVTTQVVPCNAEHNPPLTSLPKVVQDAVNKIGEYKHALGTIRYTVAPNPTNKPRSCTIRWIVNSQECPSRDFTITQLGALVCKCNDLKVSGDKTIDSSARSNFEIGTYTAGCVTNITVSEPADWITRISANNGSIKASVNENTSTTNTRATEITVKGMARTVECKKYFTLTQNPKTETCTCNDLIISGKTISYEAKDSVQIGSYSINCVTNISATSSLEWVTILSANNGKIFAKVTENESTESARTANITVTGKAGSNTCTKTFTLIQNKKVTACTTCEDANIEGLSGGATAEGGTNIKIGSFSYNCDLGLTAKRVSGGDFITNMTVSNGNVYGTVSPNTTTSERTEDIGIYVGTSKCAQYTLTQPAQSGDWSITSVTYSGEDKCESATTATTSDGRLAFSYGKTGTIPSGTYPKFTVRYGSLTGQKALTSFNATTYGYGDFLLSSMSIKSIGTYYIISDDNPNAYTTFKIIECVDPEPYKKGFIFYVEMNSNGDVKMGTEDGSLVTGYTTPTASIGSMHTSTGDCSISAYVTIGDSAHTSNSQCVRYAMNENLIADAITNKKVSLSPSTYNGKKTYMMWFDFVSQKTYYWDSDKNIYIV